MYKTAVGQLLWVSQQRVDILFAVKDPSEPYIKGTTHHKVTLAPKAEHNEQGQSKSTLTLALTTTGQDAVAQEGAPQLHFHRLKLNSTQRDKQQLNHNTSNK
eukprot:5229981-Amphidinium_carterae.1